VTFPKSNANHNPDQVFYYDENFMQRRMDFSPYVTGSLPIAHYIHDPKPFDGFVFPTRRRVHLHDAGGVADQRVAAITIDIGDVAVAWSAAGPGVLRPARRPAAGGEFVRQQASIDSRLAGAAAKP
jgi:hypothetical protein